MMINHSSSEAWTFINASGPTLPVPTSAANRSNMEAYLQRLAHLDEGLYNDFYGLWVTLIVINCLIFLVGDFFFCLTYFFFHSCFNISLCFPGGHGPQHCCTVRFLFPHQSKDHIGDLHDQPGRDRLDGEPISPNPHPAVLQWRCLPHLLLHAHFQLLCQHVLQHRVSNLHMRGPLPRHCAGEWRVHSCVHCYLLTPL